ncbi:hypothetical protein TNIN_394361, partial [Trichonephila inaurata madagascariensis]
NTYSACGTSSWLKKTEKCCHHFEMESPNA